MDPFVLFTALIILVGIPSVVILKVARLRARAASPSADVNGRLETLERDVQSLRQELAETQERLDFSERLLTKAREERHIGP